MTARHPLCDPMPLLSSAFEPGRCRELVESMPEGPARDVARAELLYFTGQAEAAAAAARPLLASDDLSVLLSASLVLGYASLSLGQADDARAALGTARAAVGEGLDDADPLATAVASFFVTTARTLLHLPLPERVPPLKDCVGLLPEGLRPFALYVLAHQAYLVGEHGRCVGVAEAALAVQGEERPITNTYLHLACVMGYVGMRDVGAARAHLLAAWDLARPDAHCAQLDQPGDCRPPWGLRQHRQAVSLTRHGEAWGGKSQGARALHAALAAHRLLLPSVA